MISLFAFFSLMSCPCRINITLMSEKKNLSRLKLVLAMAYHLSYFSWCESRFCTPCSLEKPVAPAASPEMWRLATKCRSLLYPVLVADKAYHRYIEDIILRQLMSWRCRIIIGRSSQRYSSAANSDSRNRDLN